MIPGDNDWLRSQFSGLGSSPVLKQQPVRAKKEITSATKRLYKVEAESWELFKSSLGTTEVRPELQVLQLYFKWFALTHKGRLDARPTQSTLIWRVGRFSYMYADYHGVKIPNEVKDAVVYYIQLESADELSLTTKTYEKNLTTDVDVDEMLEYLWKEDVQELVLFYGRSATMMDVQVYVVRKKQGGVYYRLDVTFHNMKGARLDDAKLIEKRGSSRISDTLAWSSGSALNQQKKICVLNMLDGNPNVSSAQRNQIAGQGNSVVFITTQHSAVVVSKFFKGRATRVKDEDDDDDDDVRGMRLQRDRNVPPELPEHLWEQITNTDKDLQIIDENRKLVRHELASALTNGPSAHVARLRKQLQQLTRKFYLRRQNLKSQEYTKFRAEWFKTRASNVLGPSPLHRAYKTTEFSPARMAAPRG
ncbi:hypothetical protein V492_02309 [Pseudogymnoascus sp. VKM F-4246]|nr:hypothetical protein V492_02309 [Pseudogymnoascus sp. VKM F-4246]